MDVDQAQLELQLKVWKELAISKQVLMRGAAEALKLDPNCSHDELKNALEEVIKKIAAAEASVVDTREQAKQSIAALEKKLAATAKAQSIAEAQAAELLKSKENINQAITIERAAAANELKKAKERLAEKEREIKAINTALSDTPENVIKKMNALKKDKRTESDLRRQEETTANTLRAEKRKVEQQLADVQKNTTTLVTQYRELHTVSSQLFDQLKETGKDAKDLPTLPELDTDLLESIEDPEAKAAKDKESKDAKGSKEKKKK